MWRRTRRPHPVFVGGTGRSGTSVLGKLIGEHPSFADLPFELRFHVDNHGLAHLLSGRTTMAAFEERMRGKWYRRKGGVRGLHRLVDEETLERNLTDFKRRFQRNPKRAARRLIDAIVAAYLREEPGENWVESTPYNLRGAEVLHRVYPRARFIHVMRDGRDVASSVTRCSWGPDDFREALAWWEDRRAQAEEGARQVPADRLLEIQFEDLVVHRREETYGRLLDFLELDDEPRMRAFFEKKMPAARGNLDRWREDVPEDERSTVSKEYEAMLERLQLSRS